MDISIKVIAGSTREGRFSHQPATWITELLGRHEGVTATMLDLRDYPMPFFDAAESPSMKSKPYEHPVVAKFTEEIASADGFVMVTPEYNRGPSGVLKNAIDWVYPEWNKKAVGFISYGTLGGARAVEQLRTNAIELQMAPIRTSLNFTGDKYFPVAFGKASVEDLLAGHEAQAQKFIEELLWWTRALKVARQ